MLHPDQFRVNEAWIAFRLNEVPVSTEVDGDFNVMALMDAASCFILGTALVPATSVELSEMEVKRLIKHGWAHKQQLPGPLFIPTNLTADILSSEAERQGITVMRVPEEQLLLFIAEAREGFREHVSRGSLQ